MPLLFITLLYPIIGFELIIFLMFINFRKTEHKNLKQYILPIALMFGTYGYCIAFHNNGSITDLQRYMQIIQTSYSGSFFQILKNDTNFLYTQDLLFYFVSKTGNASILPFIVGVIIYGIVFYVLFDMVERSNRDYKISEIFMLAVIAIGIISPYSIIGNVRCILSYVILTFAIYREVIQKKRNLITYLLYIMPLGLHSSAIIVLGIRIISILLKKVTKLSLVAIIALPNLINIMHSYTSYINIGLIGNLLVNAINKAYSYLNWTEGGWASAIENSISDKVNRISGIFFLAIIIITIFSKGKKKNTDEKTAIIKKPMVNYLYFMSIFALGCLSIKTGAFWRFESIIVLFSPVLMVQLLEYDNKYTKTFKLLFTFSFLMLLINIVYQIRNIDVYMTTINLLQTTGLKIIYEIIKGIIYLI